MSSLFLLIPIAMMFVFIAIMIFIWAVKTDQFDDLERQGLDILMEEISQKPSSRPPQNKE